MAINFKSESKKHQTMIVFVLNHGSAHFKKKIKEIDGNPYILVCV